MRGACKISLAGANGLIKSSGASIRVLHANGALSLLSRHKNLHFRSLLWKRSLTTFVYGVSLRWQPENNRFSLNVDAAARKDCLLDLHAPKQQQQQQGEMRTTLAPLPRLLIKRDTPHAAAVGWTLQTTLPPDWLVCNHVGCSCKDEEWYCWMRLNFSVYLVNSSIVLL